MVKGSLAQDILGHGFWQRAPLYGTELPTGTVFSIKVLPVTGFSGRVLPVTELHVT